MPANTFQLKIEGPDVTPESVDIVDLVKVLTALRSAVELIAKSDQGRGGDVALSLTGIGEGSDLLTLSGSPIALRSTSRLTVAIANNRFDSLPPAVHQHLRTIWKTTFDNGWTRCQFLANGSQITSTEISEDRELFPDKALFRGRTTVYGECVRVGGDVRKSATLKLLSGGTKTIRLKSKELAKELGSRLYQTVGLNGEAFWSVENRQLEDFRADELTPFRDRDDDAKERTIRQSFEALAAAAGNRWDNVDPDKFVAALRCD